MKKENCVHDVSTTVTTVRITCDRLVSTNTVELLYRNGCLPKKMSARHETGKKHVSIMFNWLECLHIGGEGKYTEIQNVHLLKF